MSKERSIINEVTELFADPAGIQNDFAEALDLMRAHLHKKYIDKIAKAVEACEYNTVNNPSNEVRLLKAFKPFAAPEAHTKIDEFVSILQKINSLGELRSSFKLLPEDTAISAQSVNAAVANPSVHDDGVYDVDEKCVVISNDGYQPNNMAGVFMMLAMLNAQNKA